MEAPDRTRATISKLRGFLLVILVLCMLGTGAELLLVGHTEEVWQWVPLVLISICLVVLGWHAINRRAASIRVLQGVMVLFMIGGVAGFVLHAQAKMEFQREGNPSLSGAKLFWKAMRSISPPALAPGMLIQMGLLGLAYAYRHPALSARAGNPSSETGEET